MSNEIFSFIITSFRKDLKHLHNFLLPNIEQIMLNWFMHPVARVSINKYRNLRKVKVKLSRNRPWRPIGL
jgi:hypothetical protein